MQESLRGVMRVELSVDAEFAAPPAAQELSTEVKAVTSWLAGSELFGAPLLLDDDDATSGPKPSEQGPTVGEAVDTQGETARVDDPITVSVVYCPRTAANVEC
jgi:hypothetical protein